MENNSLKLWPYLQFMFIVQICFDVDMRPQLNAILSQSNSIFYIQDDF